jgi:hypothetical protein
MRGWQSGPRSFSDLGAGDQDGFLGHVLVGAMIAARRRNDSVHHIHASGDFTEHCVAKAILTRVIEHGVVFHVDEELAGGAVRHAGAGHGDAAAHVFQAVARLDGDGGSGFLLIHLRIKATALDHETWDDPMENGAGVVTALDVVGEVLGADWSFGRVEFEFDGAFGGFEGDFHEGSKGWMGCLAWDDATVKAGRVKSMAWRTRK